MSLTTQKYDILSRIAVGHGALIYRALDKETMRQVALKLLNQDADSDYALNVEALMDEVPRLRQFTGAHVCQLLDAYLDEDGPVLVYEFAAGQNGHEQGMARTLTPAEAPDVAAQLISALRSGERQRCPHGDLKPSNIMFVDLPEGRQFLIVTDWGLATFRENAPLDSLTFTAPERLDGAPASHRSDLFSAGAVLFFFLTRKTLVGGRDRDELRAKWAQARPSVLGEMRPDLPAKFVQWVCTLLEADPEKRPSSAVEAGAALALLNPPAPPLAPESVRPRPAAAARPAAPMGSGIARQPSAPAAPPVPPPQSASSPRDSRGVPGSRPAASPAKSTHLGVTLSIYAALLAAAGVGGWYLLSGKGDPEKTDQPSEAERQLATAAKPGPTRTTPAGAPATTASVTPAVAPAAVRNPPPSAQKPPPPKIPALPAKPAPGQSPLIAAESFEYGAGKPIGGLAGGSGWAGPWIGSLATVYAGSLQSPGFPDRGGSMEIPPVQQELRLSRRLGPLSQFVDPAKGGVWYFAMLFQHASAIPVSGSDVHFNPFNETDIFDLVRIVASYTGGPVSLTLNTEKTLLEVKNPSYPALVVMRITLDNPKLGNWDVTAELYVNPVIDAAWPASDAPKVRIKQPYVKVPDQLGLLIRKPARSEAVTRIDEIRFARNATELAWRPVTPTVQVPAPANGAAARK